MMVPKFRAWDKEAKMLRDYDEIKGLCLDALDASRLELEKPTGLKDVNGKKIYEGDILEYYYVTHGQTFYDPDTLGAVGGEPGIETTVIGKVAIWPSTGVVLTRIKAEYPEDFDSSNLDVPKMLHVNKRFTIIGNIHENPELLEAEHDTRTA